MIHCIPVKDRIEHRADCQCCHAHLDVDGFFIHHALDKREQFERHGHIGKGWELWWEDSTAKTFELLNDE